MNESLLKISSADLCYGKKLFLKVLLNLFLGFITLKHWRITFCNTCTFLCMLPLKTVTFYKSEIAFIFILQKKFLQRFISKKISSMVEGYLFCKKLYDLQEKITNGDTNWINFFHKIRYLGYWITEILKNLFYQ